MVLTLCIIMHRPARVKLLSRKVCAVRDRRGVVERAAGRYTCASMADRNIARLSSAWILLPITFWGSSFAFTKIALGAFHPIGLVAMRFALGATLVYAYLLARREKLLPQRADRGIAIFLGCVLGAHLLLQGFALRSASAIDSGWIVGFCPVTIALGAQLFLGERLRAIGWLGVLLATLGVWLVAFAGVTDMVRVQLGDLLVLASTVTWAVYSLASIGTVARNGALRVSAFAMAVGACVCAIASLGARVVIATPGWPEVGSVLFLGLLCSGVAFSVWFRAIEAFGPARIGALIYLQPFVSLVVGASVLHEPITPYALLGGPLVLLGVWLVSRGSPRRKAMHTQAIAVPATPSLAPGDALEN
jgi:drug/metabolite transporter (DMT)-like permease